MKREEVERKLELAETSLRQAAARLEATQQQLAEIEDQRAQILGESEIARRAMADFERLSEQSRNELAAVELEDARVALAEAVQARDQIVANAAAALDTAVGLLGEIDEHRNAVVQAHQRVRSLDQAAGQAAPEEPDVLHEPWERMASVVKTELDEQLESDIVDAAARSHLPHAINALPQHLRILATQRRQEMQRERMQAERARIKRPKKTARP